MILSLNVGHFSFGCNSRKGSSTSFYVSSELFSHCIGTGDETKFVKLILIDPAQLSFVMAPLPLDPMPSFGCAINFLISTARTVHVVDGTCRSDHEADGLLQSGLHRARFSMYRVCMHVH